MLFYTAEGGFSMEESKYYTDPNGNVWVSEEDYKAYAARVEASYVAPDATVWASKADYDAYGAQTQEETAKSR